MRVILVGSPRERERLRAAFDNGAQVRAREGAERGLGTPRATEPGHGAEPHLMMNGSIDVVGEFASLADARAADLDADAIVVAKKGPGAVERLENSSRSLYEEALTPREI